MKLVPSLLLVVICICGVAAAQQPQPQSSGVGAMESPEPGASQSSSVFIVPRADACPVSMQARQSGMTDLVKVNRGAPAEQQPDAGTLSKPSQRIELLVARSEAAGRMVGATVTVRGLSARGRVDRSASGSGHGDVRRTFDIAFLPKDDKMLSAELVLPGFTSVTSIKLESLRYADGSRRDFSAQKLCTVTPDPMMLIAGR